VKRPKMKPPAFPTAQLLLQYWSNPTLRALHQAHHRIKELYLCGLDVLGVGCGRAR